MPEYRFALMSMHSPQCPPLRRNAGLLLCLLLFLSVNLFASTPAFSTTPYTLIDNRWSMISLPASSPAGNTVALLFGDELPIESYGSSGDWVIFSYDPQNNRYVEAPLNSELTAGTGYWIFQSSGSDVEISIAADSQPFETSDSAACPGNNGCIEVSLTANAAYPTWNLLGFPQADAQSFGNTRVRTATGVCAAGCSPAQAKANNVMDDVLIRSNGEDFERVSSTTALQPWDALWALILPGAHSQSPTWLIPAPNIVEPPQDDRDAARLLTQATFGATSADIAAVNALGGPAAWIDAQINLAPTYHVPLIHAIADDGWGDQPDRYQVFWEQALRANDQLRQRVAFALSEIMVISDIPDALINHGNLVGDYYDILLEHSFGNYRELLEAVTLSPAMGIYLSMLGNDKPDVATGRRADENYAREVMQLFSIGLVQLNIDGQVKLDANGRAIPTYTQSDVKNLANALTGWSWDGPEWQVSPVAGWYPDLSRMERPMKAFAEHHDTTEKRFLDVTLPAGQSAQQDIEAAMDVLFNHPNVAPFISRQLIQRLVSSNPSGGYIARVASVFNDNGEGVRGDLGAVVKAILLDTEARSPSLAAGDDFGKLREPVLRLSHLWRAFKVSDPIPMGFWKTELSQHAPLTANSVFNFFSPDFSPSGAIKQAGLTAPEFQINSETALNRLNGALMWVVQLDSFFNVFPSKLDLSIEDNLFSDPPALIDHLDLLLTSNSMSSELKTLLLDYIEQNTAIAGQDRTLRDVIALIITSADYAIQR